MVLREDEYKNDFQPKHEAYGGSESGYMREVLGYLSRRQKSDNSAVKPARKTAKRKNEKATKRAIDSVVKSRLPYKTQRGQVTELEILGGEAAVHNPIANDIPNDFPLDLGGTPNTVAGSQRVGEQVRGNDQQQSPGDDLRLAYAQDISDGLTGVLTMLETSTFPAEEKQLTLDVQADDE